MSNFPIITILTFVPFAGALILAFGRSLDKTLARRFALAARSHQAAAEMVPGQRWAD